MSGLGQLMLRHEARVGAKIFHKPAASKKRGFYCLDETTWVWSQDKMFVIYKINPGSIYKSNDGITYRLASEEEAEKLYKAAKIYCGMVNKIYRALIGGRA